MTLLEILVTFAIIATLIFTAIGFYTDLRAGGGETVVREHLRVSREALARHFKRTMTYPEDLAAFIAVNFPGQTASGMFLLSQLDAEPTLLLEVPDIEAGASSNAWLATRTLFVPWSPRTGGPGRQFRNLKIRVGAATMDW